MSQHLDIYDRKAGSLYERCISDTGIACPTWTTVAKWAVKRVAPEVSKPTWRIYRNALIRVSGEPSVADALSGVTGRAKSSHRPQGYWSQADLCLFGEWAPFGSGPAANAAIAWLDATIQTGLRPMEWFDASLSFDAKVLRVSTVRKRDGVPTAPAVREIPLDDACLATIKAQLAYVAPYRDKPLAERERCYRSVQNVICRAGREVFGFRRLRPTIYCARHEFAHRLLDSKCTVDRIALLLGDTPETVRQLYCAKGNSTRRQRNERKRG